MLRLKRSLLIVALVAVVSIAAGVGRTTNAEEPTPPAEVLAAFSQPDVSPAVVVPGGPGFFSQSAYSFRPSSMFTQWAFNGPFLYNPGTQGDSFFSSVSLPHGATVNKVVWYYYDNSSTNNITFSLNRTSLDIPGMVMMADASSTGAQNTYRYVETTSISYPTVDLQSNAYYVQVYLPADPYLRFVSYRIDYQYPGFLPTVMKNSN